MNILEFILLIPFLVAFGWALRHTEADPDDPRW